MNFNVNGKEISWEPQNFIIAGYTAKDQAALKAHIEELEKIGVAAPKAVPMIYQLSPELLSTERVISTVRNDGSGEAEVVLLHIEGGWYVGIGSDHTDRVLEATSVQKSKQVCAKPISKELWPLNSIEDHWDEIELKSWYSVNGEEHLYQSGKLEAFLSPKELLNIIEARGYTTANTALFCGTLPILSKEFLFGEEFRAELYDARNDKKLELSYQTKILIDSEVV
ncbi:uncharacterized protein DUF2848 [Neobacillus bataviensis]|uniref:Uncharacterized protein DUF2848 n=1 Tax=Neobacillus bataviensis TaxID=220685 RepID=A0A561CQC2_9BACI|nr:DUF2848 family protein [Neobacillus bataviensis]TWD93431.1 uncharacterized protein DUF2848 [Neobacillus bataviensis]